MAQDNEVSYQLDCSMVSTEMLVHMRDNVGKLIASQEKQLWAINDELMGRLEDNGGAIYGSDHILEAKEGRATFSPWMFRPFMEIFMTSELDDCYSPATTGACVPCNGKGQVDIDEHWKTSTVRKYAEKHQRLDLYEAARTPGAPTIKVTWIKEGGEIDTDRN